MTSKYFEQSTLLIITGAAGGYGRSLAIAFSNKIQCDSTLFIIDKLNDELNETKSLIGNSKVDVHAVCSDLSKPSETETVIEKCFEKLKGRSFQHYILINNAGSTGDVSKFASDFKYHAVSGEYLSLNVSSPMVLTSRFIAAIGDREGKNISVVNVSSINAWKPAGGYGMYSAGKAAREMYFKVLVAEIPEIVALNWAPGPMNTKMYHEVMAQTNSEEYRALLEEYLNDGLVPSCEVPANKLWGVLEKNKFTTGDHMHIDDA